MPGPIDRAQDAALDHQVELLGSGDWRRQVAATQVLEQAGQAGFDAVVRGLAHPKARVRRYSADFFDHHGDDRCTAILHRVLHTDPVPRVRGAALHALSCQRCKVAPLQADLIPLLLEGLADPHRHVREGAVSGLLQQPPDRRVVAPLRALLGQEPDGLLRRLTHRALRRHDPAYRTAADQEARARAMRHVGP